MPTRGLIVLAVVTVTTVAASWIAVDKRYRQTVLEARGGEVVFPDLRGRTGSVAVIEVGRAGTGFALERVGKTGATFDLDRLEAMNGHYVRALPPDQFAERLRCSLRRRCSAVCTMG